MAEPKPEAPKRPLRPDLALIAGYACPIIALGLIPIAFGLAGLVFGVINIGRKRLAHGVAQIGLAAVCTVAGCAIGFVSGYRAVSRRPAAAASSETGQTASARAASSVGDTGNNSTPGWVVKNTYDPSTTKSSRFVTLDGAYYGNTEPSDVAEGNALSALSGSAAKAPYIEVECDGGRLNGASVAEIDFRTPLRPWGVGVAATQVTVALDGHPLIAFARHPMDDNYNVGTTELLGESGVPLFTRPLFLALLTGSRTGANPVGGVLSVGGTTDDGNSVVVQFLLPSDTAVVLNRACGLHLRQ